MALTVHFSILFMEHELVMAMNAQTGMPDEPVARLATGLLGSSCPKPRSLTLCVQYTGAYMKREQDNKMNKG